MADLLQTGDLQRLRVEADRRRSLTESVRARLPAPAADHLTGAHREADGRLVLTADSAAWAARLRFIADDAGLANITVRVAPTGESGPDGIR